MKNFKVILFAMVAAFALVSCNNLDKVLIKKDGRWNTTSVQTIVLVDGAEFLNLTLTDSLGYSVFSDEGMGETFLDDGTSAGTFTWMTNDDDTQITITQDGESTTYDITDQDKNNMTWYNSTTVTDQGITTETQTTVMAQRPE